MKKRVVITGIGVIAPCGIGIDKFWANSISGQSYIRAYDDFLISDIKSRVVGKINSINYSELNISQDDIDKFGRHILLALIAANEALTNSKINIGSINKERIGVCMGNAIADTAMAENQYLKIKKRQSDKNTKNVPVEIISDKLFFKAMFNCISTELAARYNLAGPSFTISTGCTSGIDAVGAAFEAIQYGDADIMLAGASEAPVANMTMASFDRIGAISTKNHFPNKASSPFDLTRDGFVLAEGAGILLLEELEHALKRNANIYGEIAGYSTHNNAWHMTDLPKDGEALAVTINDVLKEANMEATNIDYINAHGSSTVQNDIFETSAYKKVFGLHAYSIPISSTKSVIGHPLGAASAIELVHCCLAMKHNICPPTVNLDTPDPQCDLDYVSNKKRKAQINNVLTNANGFSGIHSAMILKKL